MSTFAARLREERERLGLSQPAFGELCGVGKHAQINYEAGRRSPDGDYLIGAAAAGVDVLYVVTGERREPSPANVSDPQDVIRALADQPRQALIDAAMGIEHALIARAARLPDGDPDPTFLADFVPVPLHAAELAAGTGHINDNEAVIGQLAFRRDWLKRVGIAPGTGVLARARGESMSPTIRDGDMVLIDRARTMVPAKVRGPEDRRPRPIHALLGEDGARLKRLDLAAPGVLAILSDNPAFPPEFRPVAEVTIIGRVVWWGHTVKE